MTKKIKFPVIRIEDYFPEYPKIIDKIRAKIKAKNIDNMDFQKVKELYYSGLKTIVNPTMKNLGFKKEGRFKYYKVDGDFYQHFTFDRSSMNPSQFSVNVGIIILSLPIGFTEKVEFPQIPAKRGAGLRFFGELRDLSDNYKFVEESLRNALNWIQTEGIRWLNRYSDYEELKRICSEERAKLTEKYMIGWDLHLIEAIALEKTGEKDKALKVYKNIPKKYWDNFGKGPQEFVKMKIMELEK